MKLDLSPIFMLSRPILRLALLLVALLLFVVAPVVSAEQGQLLDAETGKPVEGVFVIATWHGYVSDFVQRSSKCYYLETAVTDANGKFVVSRYSGNWSMWISERSRRFTFYKMGYSGKWTQERESPNLWRLSREAVDAKGRLDRIKRIQNNSACGDSAEHPTKLGPLFRALLAEAESLGLQDRDSLEAIRGLRLGAIAIHAIQASQDAKGAKPSNEGQSR